MSFRALLCALALPLAAQAAAPSLTFTPPAGAPANGKHVVLLSGDEEYRSEEALPMLAKILSQRHGFRCTVLFPLDPDGTINPENQRSLAGSAALDTADAIVMSLRFRNWLEADMARFVAAFNRGVPIIALRTSTHAFNIPAGGPHSQYSWNSRAPWPGGFGKHVLGETWISHWGRHKFEATRGVAEPAHAADPILRGVKDVFGDSDVYEAYPPADARILMRGLVLKGMNPGDAPADHAKPRATDKQPQGVNSPAMPIAWTRLFRNEAGKENRIFTTTLGAATDLVNEGSRRLVVNAVFWGLGLDVPAAADVRFVDPFNPKPYGFKGYRYRLTPDDYALGKEVPPGATPPPAPPKPAPAKKAAKQASAGGNAAAPAASTAAAAPAPAAKPGFQLNAGERVAIVGNALADRMQHHGWLETMIHLRHPEHNVTVRNLAFAGDEVVTRARSKDFGTPDEWLGKVQAGVVFAFFGYNESFAGPEGLPKFREELATFLRETRARTYNGLAPPRIVLFSPTAVEKLPDPNFEHKPQVNANLETYTRAMAEVARDLAGVTFVDLFTPSKRLFEEAARKGEPPLTINGVHFNDAGEGRLSREIYPALFGGSAPDVDAPAARKLRSLVNEKSAMWHSRYRSVDGYNIYGDRSKIAYVSHPDAPKITNTQVMMEELAQRDVMTTNLERRVWAAAAGKTGPVEMLPLPVVTAFGTNKPGPNIDGTYPFLDGDEATSLMTLAPGLQVNLFASEKQFPELAKPVQMAWDAKGRLWVAAWPSYPGRTPTSKVADKLLVLEDTDRDGRADKCTVFLDGLNCPTGFNFYKDGVLVVQAPDLWYVRDTDGDGRADWKERILMGLDSADSHHQTNAMIYEPGGALLLSDGVFHRTQVEGVEGAVRNIDGAIFRYEPLTGKFDRYVAYGFANPHGRAFDRWGNDLIVDATGNNTYFGPAFSGRIDHPGKHPRMKTVWDRPARPSAGSTFLTSRHFPEEYWGSFLNPNVIGFQGIYRVKMVDDGSGLKGERQPDVISSTDRNFRPIDTTTGPDGALYVCDWHNPLIGHLQSHLRDSNRDHVHGRIYRITAKDRPLAWQPKIAGEPIPALLELLKRGENHIRNLAKIELGNHDSERVVAAAKAWAAKLDPAAPDHAHHLAEALWVHQWHNRVDLDLLSRQLNSPSADARAAAVRVLCYWREKVPNALAELRRLAVDEHPRVRLQAVRAASFFTVVEATEVALAALQKPVDYYLDYVIGETLRQLRPQWRQRIGEGGNFAGGDPAATRYLLRTLTVAEVQAMPRTADVSENLLGRSSVNDATRAEALAALAKARGAEPVALLLRTLESPGEIDAKGVGRLLLNQPAAALAQHRAGLLKLAMADTADGRTYAWAALALADKTLERVWQEAATSPLSRASLLGGIPLIPDAALRATAFERVMPILGQAITDIQGPDNIVAAIQRDAIRSAVSTRREPAAVFAALTVMLERGYQVPTAAQGLRTLPRDSWSAEGAGRAARALVAWAGKAHPNERTGRDYVESVQVAEDLAGLLPANEADALRQTLSGLRVAVFVVRAVVEGMRYDTPRIVVQAGRAFDLIFDNPDVMPHNLVVVKPGTREQVGVAAAAMTPEARDSKGRTFVPDLGSVVAATKMLEAGQSETLKIPASALRTEGEYEYVCTFPGHWAMMWGKLIVTKDVDAYLKANPATPAAAAAAAPHGGSGHNH
ncbi:MAG: hypothetical protein RLZZ188_2493 [Verrucomicrobiota bacterium]